MNKQETPHVHKAGPRGDRIYDYCECGAVRLAKDPNDKWHVCDKCRV